MQMEMQNQQQIPVALPFSQSTVPRAIMNMQHGYSNAQMHSNAMQYAPQGPNAPWASSETAPQYPMPRSSTLATPRSEPEPPIADDPTTWPAELRTLIEQSRQRNEPVTAGVVYHVNVDVYSYDPDTSDVIATCDTLQDANMAAVEHFITDCSDAIEPSEPPIYSLIEDGRLSIEVQCVEGESVEIGIRKTEVRGRGGRARPSVSDAPVSEQRLLEASIPRQTGQKAVLLRDIYHFYIRIMAILHQAVHHPA